MALRAFPESPASQRHQVLIPPLLRPKVPQIESGVDAEAGVVNAVQGGSELPILLAKASPSSRAPPILGVAAQGPLEFAHLLA